MIHLTKSLRAWGTPEFANILKQELEQLDPGKLPLQQGLASGSYALDDRVSTMVIATSEAPGVIRAKVGIFFGGIIAGCSCADDPTPVDELTEYCVVQVDIDRQTAETTVTLLAG